jgi:hypothetical protein
MVPELALTGKTKMSFLEFGPKDKLALGCAERDLKISGPTASFTVSCWFFIQGFNEVDHSNDTGDNTIIGMDRIAINCTLHLVTRSRKLYFGFYCNDTAGNTELEEMRWYHAAFVYDAANQSQRIYLDGKLDGEGLTKPSLGGDFPVFISSYAGGRGLNGRLAFLNIYTTALPEESLRTLMFCTEEDDLVCDPQLNTHHGDLIRCPTGAYLKRGYDDSLLESISTTAGKIGVSENSLFNITLLSLP